MATMSIPNSNLVAIYVAVYAHCGNFVNILFILQCTVKTAVLF